MSSRNDFWDFSFQVAGTSAAVWLMRAYRLRRAADIMWRQATRDVKRLVAQGPDLKVPWGPEATGQAAMLLSGLTIEVLIKALLIGRGGSRVENGVFKPWGKKSKHDHDIVKLFGLAGEQLTAEERNFAEHLTKFIRWAGRYPLPKKVGEMRPKLTTTAPHRNVFDGATLPGVYSLADRVRFRRLFGRLEKTLADEGVKWTAG